MKFHLDEIVSFSLELPCNNRYKFQVGIPSWNFNRVRKSPYNQPLSSFIDTLSIWNSNEDIMHVVMTLKGNGIRVKKRKKLKNVLNFGLDCMWVVNHLPNTLLGLLSFFRSIFPFYIHWKHEKSRTFVVFQGLYLRWINFFAWTIFCGFCKF